MYALVDCNNFYASCERIFDPALIGRPIVVLSNNDGCIVARSQEAKDLGIEMGAPAFEIEALLEQHQVAVFSSNYALYGDISRRVMNVLRTVADAVEVYSIDEAFIDLRGYSPVQLEEMAEELRRRVRAWVKVPVSVGIAPTKTLAKLANRLAKKSAKAQGKCLLLEPRHIEAALRRTQVGDLWGIGGRQAALLNRYGIRTAWDFTQADETWVLRRLTITGLRTVRELKGESCIPMEQKKRKKNICTARSFGSMTQDLHVVREAVASYAARCAEKLRQEGSCAGLLQVFVESNDFRPDLPQYHNEISLELPVPSNLTPELVKVAMKGLEQIFRPGFMYKKAGVVVGAIVPQEQVQAYLFDSIDRAKYIRAMRVVDEVNGRLGRDVLRLAAQGFDRKWKLRQERLSHCYTTRWGDLLAVI